MERKKIILTQRQIELLAENELAKMRQEDADSDSESPETEEGGGEEEDDSKYMHDIDKMIGDPEGRHIEYPDAGDIEAVKNDIDDDGEGEEDKLDPRDMETPPHELLDYLESIENCKSILSKIAAKEKNENVKNRIYSHYEKAQKLAFELIKEFGIVH